GGLAPLPPDLRGGRAPESPSRARGAAVGVLRSRPRRDRPRPRDGDLPALGAHEARAPRVDVPDPRDPGRGRGRVGLRGTPPRGCARIRSSRPPSSMEDSMPALIPPTYDDAALVLRLYELRREEKIRGAREWFRTAFFPQSYDDVRTVVLTNGPENTHFRMVTG